MVRGYVSKIDGSVQYYGIVPAKREPTNVDANIKPALVLTLHGAGVEGIGQAACFTPKSNLITVAPTNRRPFGFDWEDWGRMDAIEVLQLAEEEFQTDPRRTYLTGHSMGGHGTWNVGVNFPGRFATLGPSAGWASVVAIAWCCSISARRGAARRVPGAARDFVRCGTGGSASADSMSAPPSTA